MIANVFLRITCAVFARRIAKGEDFEGIVKDYPKLTAEQVKILKKELDVK